MTLPSRVADLTGYDLLLSVARAGSLGRAAAEHRISQPAASARMRVLEAPARSRADRAVAARVPADSGRRAGGRWAQAAVDAAAGLDASITALRQEHYSRLRVAASMTVAEYLFPGWLGALRVADPDAAVALSAVNSAEVVHAVLAETADIGFVEGPDIPAGLHAEPVGRDRLTLIVAPAHPWARRRAGIPVGEVAATSLVTREAGSGTRRFLEEALLRRRRPWPRPWPNCPRPPRSRLRSRPGPARRCSARWPSRPMSRPGRCTRYRSRAST